MQRAPAILLLGKLRTMCGRPTLAKFSWHSASVAKAGPPPLTQLGVGRAVQTSTIAVHIRKPQPS
mgnify:CR=1 FL=1